MKADVQATAAKQFVDPKSYVTSDGREILHGKDWKARVDALLARSGGRCEYLAGIAGVWTMRCSVEAADPHHIELRSIKRDDRLEALLAVCRHHHRVLDAQQRAEKRAKKRARMEELA